MQRENTLLLDNWIFDLQRLGGISRYWAGLQRALLIDGVQFDIVSGQNSKNIFDAASSIEAGQHFVKEVSLRDRVLPVAMPKGCDHEIYHASYFYRPKCWKSRHVVTVHDLMYHKFDKRLLAYLFKYQFGEAVKSASDIVCVSHATRSDLLEFYPALERKNVQVIHNGVESLFFDRPQASQPAEKKYALYVGSRGTCKNFDYVLELAHSEYFCDQEIELIAVGSPPAGEELKKYQENGWDRNVKYLQAIDDAKLATLYVGAEFLLIPSLYEGFGLPAAEAMAAGCPVVHSGRGSLGEVVGSSELQIDEFSVSSGSKVLQRLSDPDTRQRIIETQKKRAENYRWENIVQAYKEFYFG